MITLAISTLLLGAALSMRFKVLILVPAITLAFITVVTVGLAGGNGFFTIAIAAVLASGCLQLGYLFGAFARFGAVSARSAKSSLRPQPRAVR
jgi:hypothetical protein